MKKQNKQPEHNSQDNVAMKLQEERAKKIINISSGNKMKSVIFDVVEFMIKDDLSLIDKDLKEITIMNIRDLESNYGIYEFSFVVAEYARSFYPKLDRYFNALSFKQGKALEQTETFRDYRAELGLDRWDAATLPYVALCIALHRNELIELADSYSLDNRKSA